MVTDNHSLKPKLTQSHNLGRDHTVHARIEGTVYFTKKQGNRTVVNIRPLGEVAETVATIAPKKKAPKKAAPKKETPAPAAAAPAAAPKATGKPDDLKKVEGIGPKIAELLGAAGILTFSDLGATDPAKIKEILAAAGNRYASHDPTTWPQQAQMAADGKWDELEKWQDELDGGRPPVAAAEEE